MEPNKIYEKLSDEERIALYKGKQILINVHRKRVLKVIGLSLLSFILIALIFAWARCQYD